MDKEGPSSNTGRLKTPSFERRLLEQLKDGVTEVISNKGEIDGKARLAGLGMGQMESGKPSRCMGDLEGERKNKRCLVYPRRLGQRFWIDAQTPDDVEQFVWEDLRKNQWVENTRTSLSKQLW